MKTQIKCSWIIYDRDSSNSRLFGNLELMTTGLVTFTLRNIELAEDGNNSAINIPCSMSPSMFTKFPACQIGQFSGDSPHRLAKTTPTEISRDITINTLVSNTHGIYHSYGNHNTWTLTCDFQSIWFHFDLFCLVVFSLKKQKWKWMHQWGFNTCMHQALVWREAWKMWHTKFSRDKYFF